LIRFGGRFPAVGWPAPCFARSGGWIGRSEGEGHMPRYYFEVRGPDRLPDPEGVVLTNVEAAWREAVKLSRALARDYPETFTPGSCWTMRVHDQTGADIALIDIRIASRAGAPPMLSHRPPDVAPHHPPSGCPLH
jgi:hypothetical protein